MSYDFLLLKLVLVPLLGAVIAARSKERGAARRWGMASVGLTLALACALVGRALTENDPGVRLDLSAGGLTLSLASDGAVAVLALSAALIHLGALAFTPARDMDVRATTALLLGEAGTMLALHAAAPPLLFVGWAASLTPVLAAPMAAGPTRLVRWSAAVSLASLAVALGLDWAGDGTSAWPAALPFASIAWIVAALARLGAPPLHAWVPVALHRARPAFMAPAIMSPLPVLALVHLMARPSPGDLAEGALLALGTGGAVYGAVLAMVQHDLRRSIGYVQASFASTLVAAIATSTGTGVAGAILGVAVGSVAVSGLVFLASAISARTGTSDMRRLGGLHRSSPLGSAVFLLCSVTIVGFPGTAGFVSEDLVMQGLVGGHPVATLAVLVAAALNAVTLFRCYERTYLGAPSSHGVAPADVEDLLPRERWIVIAWAALIVVGGFAPAPLVAIESAIRGAPSAESHGRAAMIHDGPRERE